MAAEGVDTSAMRGLALASAKQALEDSWPQHWPAVEACLAACASLLLKDVKQSLALVLTARSGGGKGTLLSMFQGASRTVWRDRFTRSSMLSGHGDTEKKTLEDRALFRLVKHKTLLVGDLNPLMKTGDRVALGAFYADFAVWLDGGGLKYDTGTHGEIGEKGDFTFVLVGGMTPVRQQLWRSMAELGARLLFFPLDEMGAGIDAEAYAGAVDNGGRAIRMTLSALLSKGVRNTPWPEFSAATKAKLSRLGAITALGQVVPTDEGPLMPTRWHIQQRLALMLAGRRLLYGGSTVESEDFAFMERIVAGTSPKHRGTTLLALDRGVETVQELADNAGVSYPTMLAVLDELQRLGVVERLGVQLTNQPGRPSDRWRLKAQNVR